MLKRAWRWLTHRHKPQPVSPAMAAWLAVNRHYGAFEVEMDDQPTMCLPALPKPTRHITQILAGVDASDAPTAPSRRYLFHCDVTVVDELDINRTQPIPALH